ncbi:hypothetical protein [Henriciella marina]|uniref:hypothetical protein n=1 Tax=Henriciella marina TaxID=453851 RepID=UPI000367473E|nr:hypothetical protein [Henriciella marina]
MRYLLVAGLLALTACGGNDSDPPEMPASGGDSVGAGGEMPVEQQPLPEIVSPLAEAPPLMPGTYCYYRDDENVTEGLQVNVMDDGAVSGSNFGIIHQEAAGYYAAFSTVLSNGALDDTAAVTFDTRTEVDGDSQSSSAIWYLSEKGAVPDGLDIMPEPSPCEGLEDKVQTEGAP